MPFVAVVDEAADEVGAGATADEVGAEAAVDEVAAGATSKKPSGV